MKTILSTILTGIANRVKPAYESVSWLGRKVSTNLRSVQNCLLLGFSHLIGIDFRSLPKNAPPVLTNGIPEQEITINPSVGIVSSDGLTRTYSWKDIKTINFKTGRCYRSGIAEVEITLLNGNRFSYNNAENFLYANLFEKLHKNTPDKQVIKIRPMFIGNGLLAREETAYTHEQTFDFKGFVALLSKDTSERKEEIERLLEILESNEFVEALNAMLFSVPVTEENLPTDCFSEDWQNLSMFASVPLLLGTLPEEFSTEKSVFINRDPIDYATQVTRIFRDEFKLMQEQACSIETIQHALNNGHFFLLNRICLALRDPQDPPCTAENLYSRILSTDENTKKEALAQFELYFGEYLKPLQEEVQFLKNRYLIEACNSDPDFYNKFIDRALEQGLYEFVFKHFLLEETYLEYKVRFGIQSITPFQNFRREYPATVEKSYNNPNRIPLTPGKIQLALLHKEFLETIEWFQKRPLDLPENLRSVVEKVKENPTEFTETKMKEVLQMKQEQINSDKKAHEKNMVGLELYKELKQKEIESFNPSSPFEIVNKSLIPRQGTVNREIDAGNYLDYMKKFYAKILKNAENDNIDRLILEGEFGDWLLNFSKNHSTVKSARK